MGNFKVRILLICLQFYWHGVVPVKGTNMRHIYVFDNKSTDPKEDNSSKILDEMSLFYVNGSRLAVRVACPNMKGGEIETSGHHRILLTVKGQLLQPEKYHKESLYK